MSTTMTSNGTTHNDDDDNVNKRPRRRITKKTHSRKKRRLSPEDRQLLVGLVVMVALYVMITIGTYKILPSSSNDSLSLETAGDQVIRGARTTTSQEDTNNNNNNVAIAKLQDTFPVHVGTDMEEIPHPGVQFSKKAKSVFGERTTLTVPKFWSPTEYGPEGIRGYLGKFGKERMTMEQAMNVGSFITTQDGQSLPTIYASVANYRDPECVPTLESIYARAEYPDRIRVAVIDQVRHGDSLCSTPAQSCDDDPQQALCQYRHLIDFYTMDAQYAVGPVFARHLGNRMYRGEYFAMQVDSHVRFTEHWDTDIARQWDSARNEYGVLSVYLSDIIGSIDPVTHKNIRGMRPIMCETDYEGAGVNKHLRHGQQPEGTPYIHGEPTLHPFWAAGFSFARGHFVVQVPYDQYLPLVFQGEEISLGLRGFTYGYDYYTPERAVCFHMYANKENKQVRKKVPLFWENTPQYSGAGAEAMKRLNGIIKMTKDPYYDKDEQLYGLGQIRSTDKFFKTFGIHTDTQTVEHHLCQFVGQPMMKKFKPHLSHDRLGINYDEIDFEWKDPKPITKRLKGKV